MDSTKRELLTRAGFSKSLIDELDASDRAIEEALIGRGYTDRDIDTMVSRISANLGELYRDADACLTPLQHFAKVVGYFNPFNYLP